ncbi:MAG: IdeS/Mac family cysteine endopeptidase [Opitutales bacterium]|nr:IdeS/Mac family cysteine endopeptidase [Opitutales bacterium]
MKLVPLIPTLILCSFPGISHAAAVWAPGVSEQGGWVDFNKTCTDSSNYMADMGMCWAASASNVITWWQTQNADKLTSANKPTETYGIDTNWDIFRTVYNDVGGNPSTAYDWYINGVGTDQYGVPVYSTSMDWSQEYDKETGTGYPTTLWDGGFLKNVGVESTAFTINSSDSFKNIVNAISDGYALSVSTRPGDGSSAHAITLWGIEYTGTIDNPENIFAYITDSDNLYGKDKLVKTTLAVKGTSLSIEYGGLVWNRVDGLRTIVVPEPSAFGLIAGTLALALVASSRRRNCRR